MNDFLVAGTAIEYVCSHAADLQVDPDRLCLAAYSAGGPLLAIGIGDPQPYIRCLVGFYAVFDIRPPITPERAPFSPIEQLKLHADKLPPIQRLVGERLERRLLPIYQQT